MKHTEIEAIFTAKVNEFIQNGYMINTATMSGHQGEITKVDFRKGNDVYRVLLEQTTEYGNHGISDVVILKVGRSTENVIRDDRPFDTMGPTFWNNRMEIVEQRKFYQIDRRADYFIEDEVKYDAMKKKQIERYKRSDERSPREELPEASRMVAVKYIKRLTGKTRVSSNDIKVFKQIGRERNSYVVECRGRNYQIM